MMLTITKPAGKSPADAISDYFAWLNVEIECADTDIGILRLHYDGGALTAQGEEEFEADEARLNGRISALCHARKAASEMLLPEGGAK